MKRPNVERDRTARLLRRQRLRLSGSCLICGKLPKVGSLTTCAPCRQKVKLNNERRKTNEKCTNCGNRVPSIGRLRCTYCAAINAELKRKARREAVLHAISKLGGACEWCGETFWKFLTFDHINNDGRSNRGKHTSIPFIRRLAEDAPKYNIRLLCWNCNCARQFRALTEDEVRLVKEVK